MPPDRHLINDYHPRFSPIRRVDNTGETSFVTNTNTNTSTNNNNSTNNIYAAAQTEYRSWYYFQGWNDRSTYSQPWVTEDVASSYLHYIRDTPISTRQRFQNSSLQLSQNVDLSGGENDNRFASIVTIEHHCNALIELNKEMIQSGIEQPPPGLDKVFARGEKVDMFLRETRQRDPNQSTTASTPPSTTRTTETTAATSNNPENFVRPSSLMTPEGFIRLPDNFVYTSIGNGNGSNGAAPTPVVNATTISNNNNNATSAASNSGNTNDTTENIPTQEAYTIDQFRKMCAKSFGAEVEVPRRGFEPRHRFYKNLRDRTLFMFCHYMMYNSDEVVNLELSNVGVTQVRDDENSVVDSAPFTLLTTLANEQRTKNTNIKYMSAAMRHANYEMCPIGALAWLFFARFDYFKEPLPNFNSENWKHVKVCPTDPKYPHQACSGKTHRTGSTRIYKLENISISNATNNRLSATRYLIKSGNYAPQKTKHDGTFRRTNNPTFESPIGIKDIKELAGYSIDDTVCKPSRDIEPPLSLLQKVFPGVEGKLAELESRPLEQQDQSAIQFLRLLLSLRAVVLQDAVMWRKRYQNLDVWSYDVFSCNEFKQFSDMVYQIQQQRQQQKQQQQQQREISNIQPSQPDFIQYQPSRATNTSRQQGQQPPEHLQSINQPINTNTVALISPMMNQCLEMMNASLSFLISCHEETLMASSERKVVKESFQRVLSLFEEFKSAINNQDQQRANELSTQLQTAFTKTTSDAKDLESRRKNKVSRLYQSLKSTSEMLAASLGTSVNALSNEPHQESQPQLRLQALQPPQPQRRQRQTQQPQYQQQQQQQFQLNLPANAIAAQNPHSTSSGVPIDTSLVTTNLQSSQPQRQPQSLITNQVNNTLGSTNHANITNANANTTNNETKTTPTENTEQETNQQFSGLMDRSITKDIRKAWQEWFDGLNGKTSVVELNNTLGTSWRQRNSGNNQWYKRRKVIIDELKWINDQGVPIEPMLNLVQNWLDDNHKSLHALNKIVQRRKPEHALQFIIERYNNGNDDNTNQ